MILSAQTIRRFCHLDRMVEPYNERATAFGMSYGLSSCGYDIRIDVPDYKPEFLDCFKEEGPPFWVVEDFLLASSVERFRMPKNVVGMVKDKSSWARCGVCVQNTIIEPGWSGYLTLEITNHSKTGYKLYDGMPIAQVVFQFLDEPTSQPYIGKYQNQERGPQRVRYEFS